MNRGVSAESPSATQAVDGVVKTMVEANERIGWPKLLMNLLACDQFPRSFQKHDENLKGLILKPDLEAALTQLTRSHIRFEGPKSQNPRCGGTHTQLHLMTECTP